MSNISNRHNVIPFVAGKSEALTGQRLSKIGFKRTRDCPNPLKSVCASIPQIDPAQIHAHLTRLLPHVGTLLESAQDGILRSLYVSNPSLSSVSDDELSVSACVNYLEAEASGGRLSAEFLENWFDQNLRDNLTVYIAEKLGFDLSTSEQDSTTAKHVKIYRDLVSMLSGKNLILTPKQIQGIRNALRIGCAEDETAVKIENKLVSLEGKPALEEMLEL